MNTRLKHIAPVLILSVLFSVSANAVMYRFKDDNGRTVMSASVPPHLVKKGYEVLNQQGRVIEVVPPALTPEQIAERDRKLEEERIAAEKAKEQEAFDKQILRQYGSPDDAAGFLKRRLEEFDALIKSRRNSIELAQKSIADNEERAADAQRNGRKVPDRVLNAIKKAQQDILESEETIKQQLTTREEVIDEFTQVIQRLEQLTGKTASEYPGNS